MGDLLVVSEVRQCGEEDIIPRDTLVRPCQSLARRGTAFAEAALEIKLKAAGFKERGGGEVW